MNSNWGYSPETLNSGQNRRFLVLCDLEIWWMTLKNNRAPLLSNICIISLSYVNSNWSYSPETAKLGYDLCDLHLWPLTLTFCMDITSVIGNNSWKFGDDPMMGTKSTRQHSTQSVRNMPPPSPRHLLPHVLQIMPKDANYDQFQPKGHHNEENPQSMTKMPGNPKFYLFH